MQELDQNLDLGKLPVSATVLPDLPQLSALLENLQAMKASPSVPGPDDALLLEMLSLGGKLKAVADFLTSITTRVTTGPDTPGPNRRCAGCGRTY